jgi:processive 1,2-diacylglycerol beta-glucosyltransferase
MMPHRIHVLYEHGADLRPYSGAYIRLLRPLTHPTLGAALSVTASTDYGGEAVDAVIVDRLWRPDISLRLAEELLTKVRGAGARLIYAVDDNFFELVNERKDWLPTPEQLQVGEYFARHADGIIVSTTPLREYLSLFNPHVTVIPNALDERLIAPRRRGSLLHLALRCARLVRRARSGAPKVVGYMGTFTHDDDLTMILPVLKAVCARYAGQVTVEIVGVLAHPETRRQLEELPIRFIDPRPDQRDYPTFLSWFTNLFWWDIALAPLQDTSFNRFKSDIKFLDYCAISAGGIYSRTPAYEFSVTHLKTGWLAEDDPRAWETALETLLADDFRRLTMGYRAALHLHRKRTLAKNAVTWLAAIDDVLAQAMPNPLECVQNQL